MSSDQAVFDVYTYEKPGLRYEIRRWPSGLWELIVEESTGRGRPARAWLLGTSFRTKEGAELVMMDDLAGRA